MISYYPKRELVCLCLDKWIRETTNEEKSLDDVMRCSLSEAGPPTRGFWMRIAPGRRSRSVLCLLAAYVDGLEPLPREETARYGPDLRATMTPGNTVKARPLESRAVRPWVEHG